MAVVVISVTSNHYQPPTLLNQASSDSELSRYRIRLSGSQPNVANDVSQRKKSSERDTHSAVSSNKQQQGLFLPMQNMRHNMSEKVAQVSEFKVHSLHCTQPLQVSLDKSFFTSVVARSQSIITYRRRATTPAVYSAKQRYVLNNIKEPLLRQSTR
jgi:hypothetical protein